MLINGIDLVRRTNNNSRFNAKRVEGAYAESIKK